MPQSINLRWTSLQVHIASKEVLGLTLHSQAPLDLLSSTCKLCTSTIKPELLEWLLHQCGCQPGPDHTCPTRHWASDISSLKDDGAAASHASRHGAGHALLSEQFSWIPSLLVNKSYLRRLAVLRASGDLSHGDADPAKFNYPCSFDYSSIPAATGNMSVQSWRSQGGPDHCLGIAFLKLAFILNTFSISPAAQ